MPHTGADRAVPPCELRSAAIDDVIEPHVVLERICAGHVIVVLVHIAKHQAASAVNVTGDRFASNGKYYVRIRRTVGHGHGKPIIGAITVELRQHVGRAGRVLFPLNDPASKRTLSGAREGETFGRFATRVHIER